MDPISVVIQRHLEKADTGYEAIRADIEEFAQGVTDFQIEVFIANGEGPIDEFPVHAYRHILAQVRPLISEIRRVALSIERKRREARRFEDVIQEGKAANSDTDLDLMEVQFAIEEMNIDLKGKWATYNTYDNLLSFIRGKYGPFTNEDLQKGEAKYWKYRLAKQMADSRQGSTTGYGPGNLNSLRNALQGSIMPDSLHKIDGMSGMAAPEVLELILQKPSG